MNLLKNYYPRELKFFTMRKIILILMILFVSFISHAQSNGVSKAKKFYIVKQEKVLPPVLDIVEGSFKFIDPSGNNALDAGEKCKIAMVIKNTGLGDAVGCTVNVKAEGDINGIIISASELLPVLKVNEELKVEIPISAASTIGSGNVNFIVSIDEPNGFGTVPSYLAVSTQGFMSPLLKVVDYSITGASATGTLAKRTPFDLQILLQNIEHGKADDVKVTLELPDDVYLLSGNDVSSYAHLASGETQSLDYNLIVNTRYSAPTIPVKVNITEKYGKYAESKIIELSLNQALSSNKIVVNAKKSSVSNIAIASLSADVDKNIPLRDEKQNNTFAVIIANENYHSESDVPFAVNDGKIFSQYCERTLGIPAQNIHFRENVTLNILRNELDWVTGVMKAYRGDAKVIFYYAGHGIPDESEKTAYLLPVDGSGKNYRTGFKLNELYSSLAKAPSKSVTVFLDACFSGTRREGDMLAHNGRGIAIKVREDQVAGNMVIFSASQGDETAYPYTDKSHGMFTYFLLKKIQETGGDISYKELGEYITSQVSKKSIVLNGKSQTPKVNPSYKILNTWENWSLVE